MEGGTNYVRYQTGIGEDNDVLRERERREESLRESRALAQIEQEEAARQRQVILEMEESRIREEREREIQRNVVEDRRRDWENRSFLERTQAHVNVFVDTVKSVPGGGSAAESLMTKAVEFFVGRIEIDDKYLFPIQKKPISFLDESSLSGPLQVRVGKETFTIDFPIETNSDNDQIKAVYDSEDGTTNPSNERPTLSRAIPLTPEHLIELEDIMKELSSEEKK